MFSSDLFYLMFLSVILPDIPGVYSAMYKLVSRTTKYGNLNAADNFLIACSKTGGCLFSAVSIFYKVQQCMFTVQLLIRACDLVKKPGTSVVLLSHNF